MVGNRKLDFVVAGAQKSGTTSLDAIFRHHPGIQMASVKETHFFDDEALDWRTPDYAKLDSYFSADDERVRGEATPVTMYWRPAVRRLHAYSPKIKLILLLRDPVTRTFANWKKEYSKGRDTALFADAIRAFPDRVRAAAEVEGLHRFYSCVERGQYGGQLSYLMQFFPKTNIHCEIFEEFFSDRAVGLRRIAEFLDIDPFPDSIPDLCRHPSKEIEYPSKLGAEDTEYLSRLFRPDILAVEDLLGRRIPAWTRNGI
jgi:hypothetical protein